jgi:hypothetical protein
VHSIVAFFVLLFSSHSAPARQTPFVEHNPPVFETSEYTPSRTDIAQQRAASIYAGSGCNSCRRTTVTSSER